MKRSFFHSVLVCAMCWLCVVAQAQAGNDDDCKALVRRVYDKLNAYGKLPEDGQMYHLEYSQQTLMRDSSKYRNSTVVVKMKASNNKVWYSTDNMELFQDETHSVVILRNNKTVYLRDSDLRSAEGKKQTLAQLTRNNDTLFATASVGQCRDAVQAGRKVRIVTMVMAEKVRAVTGVQHMVYTIDMQSETVLSLRTEYAKESKIAAVEMTFLLNERKNEQPFQTDVYPRFFTGTKLKEPLQAYKLVDVRAKRGQ